MNTYVTGMTIKQLRESRSMTQGALAEKIGVSSKTVSKWETAKGLPDISLLQPRAQALGMHVVYTCRSGEKKEFPQYKYLPLETLLQQSDYVSLHIPMPGDKKPVLGEKELAMMKPTAFLINTARGGVVDETALLNALNADKLAGAALDVFEQEPTANTELCSHPRVCVTPHIGGQTVEAQDRIGQEIVSIIQSF